MDLSPGLFACLFAILVCGCGKSDKGSRPATRRGADEAAAPTAPAPSPPAKAADSAFDSNGLLRTDRDTHVFVGMLSRNASEDMTRPSEYCLEDGGLWQGAPFRLGRVNVIGLPLDLGVVPFKKPVAVFGKREPSLDAAIRRVGDCPDGYGAEAERMQMRSDWVADEGGFRTTHAKLAETPFIRATGYEITRVHQVLGKDDRVARVRFYNPFDEDLPELEVRFHYEGGPTKPMPTFVDRKLALPSGENVVLEVPLTPTGKPLDEGNKRAKHLVGIHLRATVGNAELNIELRVH